MVVNQQIPFQFPNEITLHIKREDLIHPFISGNKFRKLKYNLLKANEEKKKQLISFKEREIEIDYKSNGLDHIRLVFIHFQKNKKY